MTDAEETGWPTYRGATPRLAGRRGRDHPLRRRSPAGPGRAAGGRRRAARPRDPASAHAASPVLGRPPSLATGHGHGRAALSSTTASPRTRASRTARSARSTRVPTASASASTWRCPDDDEFGIYAELRADGITDYVALPLGGDRRQAACQQLGDRRPGGFTTEDLVRINDLLPGAVDGGRDPPQPPDRQEPARDLCRRARRRARCWPARSPAAAAAHRQRRDLELRPPGLHRRSRSCWPRDDVIALLNDYFDTMAKPVEEHGGEILKFIGDAMLAIFPLDKADACERALRRRSRRADGMAALNGRRIERGQRALGFGLALHVGDVMYGNIGSRTRLDFTVIGPAVNVAARLESLTKELRRARCWSRARSPASARMQGRQLDASRRLPAAWRRRAASRSSACPKRPDACAPAPARGPGLRPRAAPQGQAARGPAGRDAATARGSMRSSTSAPTRASMRAPPARGGLARADPLDRAAGRSCMQASSPAAAADPAWRIAPAMALGRTAGQGPCSRCRTRAT